MAKNHSASGSLKNKIAYTLDKSLYAKTKAPRKYNS